MLPSEDSMELPTFNPLFATKPSRYVYDCSDRGESTFLDGLVKLDTQTRTAKHWNVHAHSPGEPIFVPNP
jgi:torulene dioxygenase